MKCRKTLELLFMQANICQTKIEYLFHSCVLSGHQRLPIYMKWKADLENQSFNQLIRKFDILLGSFFLADIKHFRSAFSQILSTNMPE